MILYYIIVYCYMHMQETSNIQNNVFLLLQKGTTQFYIVRCASDYQPTSLASSLKNLAPSTMKNCL